MRRTLLLMAALASAAASAGTVEVEFVKPESFADARDGMHSREDVLKSLEAWMKQVGAKRLPATQTLRIEVLDVDLAGDVFPRVALRDTRVLRGRADWPRINLRYTLREGDKVVKSGEDQVADMSYLMNSPDLQYEGPFPYEKRMLERWFVERFGDGGH